MELELGDLNWRWHLDGEILVQNWSVAVRQVFTYVYESIAPHFNQILMI